MYLQVCTFNSYHNFFHVNYTLSKIALKKKNSSTLKNASNKITEQKNFEILNRPNGEKHF